MSDGKIEDFDTIEKEVGFINGKSCTIEIKIEKLNGNPANKKSIIRLMAEERNC